MISLEHLALVGAGFVIGLVILAIRAMIDVLRDGDR